MQMQIRSNIYVLFRDARHYFKSFVKIKKLRHGGRNNYPKIRELINRVSAEVDFSPGNLVLEPVGLTLALYCLLETRPVLTAPVRVSETKIGVQQLS